MTPTDEGIRLHHLNPLPGDLVLFGELPAVVVEVGMCGGGSSRRARRWRLYVSSKRAGFVEALMVVPGGTRVKKLWSSRDV